MTGARGLTGAAIVARLAKHAEVVALVRPGAPATEPDPRIEIVRGDCTDAEAMTSALAGCEVLVHGAGIRLVPALVRASFRDVRRLIAISSAGVYSRSREAARDYLAGENALSQVRAVVGIVRPTMIYGAHRDRNIHHVIAFAARWGFLPLFGDGSAPIQPVHYADLADFVTAFALDGLQGTVDVGGPEPLSVRDAEVEVLQGLGREPRLMRLPVQPFVAVSGALDRLRRSRLRERFDRLSEDRSVDVSTAIALTGVTPRPFRLGVRQEIDEMRSVGALRAT